MQIEDLVAIILDLNLGGAWPPEIERRPPWTVGRKWRVEYTFAAPALSLEALALGGEVRGVWRYEVIADRKDEETGEERVTLRVSPERRGAAGMHFLATYAKKDLRLVGVRRFEGDEERPFELAKLPPLESATTKVDGGKAFVRKFEMQAPPAAPVAAEDAAFAGAELGKD